MYGARRTAGKFGSKERALGEWCISWVLNKGH